MRLAATFLVALLFSLPLAAQTVEEGADPQAVLEGFRRLVDRGEARELFGLPRGSFWRRQDGVDFALFAEEAAQLEPVLAAAAQPFAAVTGQAMAVAEAAPLAQAEDVSELAPQAELVMVIGPRRRLVDLAGNGAFNKAMIAQFEFGAWPFMFHFQEDAGRRGVVLLADDEPARAREAAFILATVWALGGVTLGPELEGLVTDSAEGPQLTPLGRSVFRLFFHEDLAVGMPIGEAVQRAASLLAR